MKEDLGGWDVFIAAVQMSLNDCILVRHDSRPFSLMFGRKMQGFDDYQEVSWDEKEGEEWLKNAKKWGKDIWVTIIVNVGPYKFLHLKKILKKDLAKILEDFLSL